MEFSNKKYIIVFFITLAIFLGAISLSDFFANKKIENIKSIQENISLDILSTETQFALLSELSCKDVAGAVISDQLNSVAEKIEYSEKNLSDYEELVDLKKFYSLLQIKDFLLMKNISERCKTPLHTILYFYTTETNCSDCAKQSYVLTSLRQQYPELRVYSFDYNLDLSAVRALITIYKIEDTELPAMVVGDELVAGFKSVEELEAMFPKELLDAKKARIAEEERLKKEEDAEKLDLPE